MKDKIKYEMRVVRDGLTQYKFEGHQYTLSVATHSGAYADKGTCELALFDEQDQFVPLQKHDDVMGYQPLSKVDGFLRVLESSKSPRSFFTHYFENPLDN